MSGRACITACRSMWPTLSSVLMRTHTRAPASRQRWYSAGASARANLNLAHAVVAKTIRELFSPSYYKHSDSEKFTPRDFPLNRFSKVAVHNLLSPYATPNITLDNANGEKRRLEVPRPLIDIHAT